MRILFVFVLIAALFLASCKDSAPPAEQKTESSISGVAVSSGTTAPADVLQASDVVIFSEPIDPVVLELPSTALPYWRDISAGSKPALVLFSIHPLLQPIDENLLDDVSRLMTTGSTAEYRQHDSLYRAKPLILPTQTVTAAINAGWFSEIVWVFPSTASPEQMQIDLFRKQVTEAGFLSEAEAEQLHLDGGIYAGTVRGLPFRAAHPAALPKIDKPMILHVDLGYFKGLYQGEVKTRVYDVLHDTALALYETDWSPELVTLSYSTMEGTFSLDVRFLITNFAEMLRDPTLLDGTMPQNWALRSEALYAVNFFLEGKTQEYYEQAAREYPDDAAAQYDLYRHLFFEQRKIDEALEVLDKTVSLDRGYAAAYLELAQIADKDGNLAAALELLTKAAPLVPENPMVDLYRAQFMIQSGQKEQAMPLIRQLQSLPWSKHYHEGVPQLLEAMANAEAVQPEQDASAKEAPADDEQRKRVLK